MVKEQSIISSLVELTRLRDQDAIRSKLMTALMDISDAAWLVQCRIDRGEEQARVEVVERLENPSSGRELPVLPEAVFSDAGRFQRCARSGRPEWVQDFNGCQAIIFALPGSHRHHEFVVVFEERVSERTERIVGSLLDLYDNFLGLVIENTQDPLTRLYNRGAFDIDLPAALLRIHQSVEANPSTAGRHFLVMMDLDHFKRINDTFGHLYGDEVILTFSSIMREQLEEYGRLYRYGGEEFAAILPEMPIEQVADLMEGLRQAVADHSFPQIGQVTVSIGVSELLPNHLPSSLLDHADQALYRSKEQGRNRVSFHASSSSEAETETPQPVTVDDDIFF